MKTRYVAQFMILGGVIQIIILMYIWIMILIIVAFMSLLENSQFVATLSSSLSLFPKTLIVSMAFGALISLIMTISDALWSVKPEQLCEYRIED